MSPPRPSAGFANLTAQISAVRLAPAKALGIKIERVALGVVVLAADVMGSLFFKPPWYAAAALLLLALLIAAPGVVSQAIQALINAFKDYKASGGGT